MDHVLIRRATEHDAPALRSLVETLLVGSVYHELPLYHLDLALTTAGAEATALFATSADGQPFGLAVYGFVAGASGAGKLHFVGVLAAHRGQGVGRRLTRAATHELIASGARLVVAEIADDPQLAAAHALLDSEDFSGGARIVDYYRDGADLLIRVHTP